VGYLLRGVTSEVAVYEIPLALILLERGPPGPSFSLLRHSK